MLQSLKLLSEFMGNLLCMKIVRFGLQREGRTKDGNIETNPGV
jgi:hypothetical protein